MLRRDLKELIKKIGKPSRIYIENISNGWLHCYSNQVIAVFTEDIPVDVNNKILHFKLEKGRRAIILEENMGVSLLMDPRNDECDKRSEKALKKYEKWISRF